MVEPVQSMSRRPALAATDSARAAGLAPDVVDIRLLLPRDRFVLRLKPALLPPGGRIAAFRLDMGVNRRTVSAEQVATRLGPDEWLLCGPEGEAGTIARDMAAALAGRHHSLVDLGHSRVAFSVSGARATVVINSGCPLDLSPAEFPTGHATRTLLGKCEVILERTDDAPTFEVECGRSFAAYLHDFLLEAAREFRA